MAGLFLANMPTAPRPTKTTNIVFEHHRLPSEQNECIQLEPTPSRYNMHLDVRYKIEQEQITRCCKTTYIRLLNMRGTITRPPQSRSIRRNLSTKPEEGEKTGVGKKIDFDFYFFFLHHSKSKKRRSIKTNQSQSLIQTRGHGPWRNSTLH